MDQPNRALFEMKRATQQTAANAEESVSVSEELNAYAVQLRAVVGKLLTFKKGQKKKSKAPLRLASSMLPGKAYAHRTDNSAASVDDRQP